MVTKEEFAAMLMKALEIHDQQRAAASGNTQPTETAVQHATSCPDCYKDVIETMNQKTDFVCKDCGLPLGSQEWVDKLKACPNCGKSHPMQVFSWDKQRYQEKMKENQR